MIYICDTFKQINIMNIQETLMELVKKNGVREFDPNETLSVLRYNISIFWSWGVSKMVNFKNKGLGLKVSGHHHKGWVLITLSFMDTYTVQIVSNSGEVLDTYEDIYFDGLTEVIDNRIEKIKDYQF